MNKLALSFLLIALAVSGYPIFGNFAQAYTTEIYRDTFWGSQSLGGPVVVKDGATLTISAGAKVDLNGYYLQVDGCLVAKGAAGSLIQFNDGAVSFTETSTPWNEQTSSGCIIEYAMINCTVSTVGAPKISNSYIDGEFFAAGGSPVLTSDLVTGSMKVSGSSTVSWSDFKARPVFGGSSAISYCNFAEGITTEGESVSISHSNIICGHEPFTPADASIRFAAINVDKGAAEIFCNNFTLPHDTPSAGAGIWLGTQVNAYIHDNNITDFGSGGSAGIYGAQVGNVTIEKNLISLSHRGIILGGYQAQPSGTILIEKNTISNNVVGFDGYCAPTFRYNNIYNDYEIYSTIKYVYYGQAIDAVNNWWGTADEQVIDRKLEGLIDFKPFLNSRVDDAMPDISANDLPNPASASGLTAINPLLINPFLMQIIALAAFIVVTLAVFLLVKRQRDRLPSGGVKHDP